MESFYKKLEYIKSQLKAGRFDSSLIQHADILRKMVESLKDTLRAQDEISYLKSKSIMSEVYYYFGELGKAREAVTEGEKIFDQLKAKSISLQGGAPRLIREQIRLSLAYIQANLYREHNYIECKKRILFCRDLTLRLKRPDFPCWGTQAQIMHALGRVHRQVNEFNLAEECFAESINFYYERAEQKRKLYEKGDQRDHQQLQAEISFSNYRSAIALGLGLGWVNFTKGLLTMALHHNIIPARALLAHTGDELNKAYLAILFGAIKRCLAGNSIEKLDEAISVIEKAHEDFKKAGHLRYTARASYELSMAYLYSFYLHKKQGNSKKEKEQIEKARESINTVLELSQQGSDHRWISNAYIIQSRIERWDGNYKRAEQIASEALEVANKSNQVLCKIDANLARARVRIKLKDIEGARKDLDQAQALNQRSSSVDDNDPIIPAAEPRNPRIQAVCYLNLARICVLSEEGSQAKEYLSLGRDLLKGVEHVIIHKLADNIEKEVNKLNRNFIIQADDKLKDNIEHEYYNWGLKAFLIRQAYLQTKNKNKVAELLGISVNTLKNWQTEIETLNRSKKLYLP